jgi:hypothetical protein
MPADPKRVKDLFLAAVEKATPQERAAFLDEACGADEELRRRIDELLRGHDETGGLAGVVERDQPAGSPKDDTRTSFFVPSSIN